MKALTKIQTFSLFLKQLKGTELISVNLFDVRHKGDLQFDLFLVCGCISNMSTGEQNYTFVKNKVVHYMH